jgi:hypothetical protein
MAVVASTLLAIEIAVTLVAAVRGIATLVDRRRRTRIVDERAAAFLRAHDGAAAVSVATHHAFIPARRAASGLLARLGPRAAIIKLRRRGAGRCEQRHEGKQGAHTTLHCNDRSVGYASEIRE